MNAFARIAIGFSFFLVAFTCYSQSKYGDVTIDELKMTSYPNDSTADAVILLKEGDTHFVYDDQSGFRYEYSIKMKVKILTNDGLDWCNQSISYTEISRTRKEDIRGLSGTTYTLEDGKIVKTKLSKDYIFDEDIDNTYKLKKFTLPAAKVGSVIEFKYTIASDFLYELRDFTFQSKKAPTMFVRCEIELPEYFNYNVNQLGYESLFPNNTPVNKTFLVSYRDDSGRPQTERVSCSAKKIEYTGKNLPRLKDEPYIWSLDNYMSKLTFELQSTNFPFAMMKTFTTTWADVDKDLFESSSFGGNLKRAGMFKDQVEKQTPTIEYAGTILSMIKDNVKWNEKTSMYPSNLKDALKNGIGNNADINFLLINALKASDYDAFPVILSTRSNGLIPLTHPTNSAFNYVITGIRIDTLTYFVDASDKYGNWNVLPEKCMVTQARMMVEKQASWVDLSMISTAKSVKLAEFSFADSKYTAKVSEMYNDISARLFKRNYYSAKDQDEFIEKLGVRLAGDVSDFEIAGHDAPGNVKLSYTMTKNGSMQGEEIIYLNPMLEKFYSENPFKDETRKFPVNLDYLNNYTQIVNINLPEGYVIEELPKAEKFSTENGALVAVYKIGKTGDKVSLNFNFRINQLLFLQTDYDVLRDFFAKIASKNSEQIVLKKIAE